MVFSPTYRLMEHRCHEIKVSFFKLYYSSFLFFSLKHKGFKKLLEKALIDNVFLYCNTRLHLSVY